MTTKATPHPQAEQRFYGTPRPLPRILFCHVPIPGVGDRTRWCGRYWAANTPVQYETCSKERAAHVRLCTTRATLTVPSVPYIAGRRP